MKAQGKEKAQLFTVITRTHRQKISAEEMTQREFPNIDKAEGYAIGADGRLYLLDYDGSWYYVDDIKYKARFGAGV